MLVYVLVFSVYLKINIPHYALFLMAGILPWQWFASSVQAATSSIVDGRIYVGRAVFPASVLTLVPVLSNLMNLLISLPILIAIGAFFHVLPGWPILALPVLWVFSCCSPPPSRCCWRRSTCFSAICSNW